MPTILFNAFSFLQKKLEAQDRPYANAAIEVAEGTTVAALIAAMGLEAEEVEAVFVNGSVQPIETLLHHRDRVAVIPPGTPGPYRVLLGMVNKDKDT
jgi:sulfur carrier protein ThiS